MKGFRPLLLKQLAMLMGICYLLNPLHLQIKIIFHEISHILELPNNILLHKAPLDHESKTHKYHKHSTIEVEHEHLLLDFVDSMFEASNTDDHSDESLLFDMKLNKHIAAYQYLEKSFVTTEKYPDFYMTEKKSNRGHLKKLIEPPI